MTAYRTNTNTRIVALSIGAGALTFEAHIHSSRVRIVGLSGETLAVLDIEERARLRDWLDSVALVLTHYAASPCACNHSRGEHADASPHGCARDCACERFQPREQSRIAQ